MSKQRFLIVGAGLAGGTAARALRQQGFQGEVVVVGAEGHLPYIRPPLSKEYLRGEAPFADQFVNPPESYASNGIELRLGARAARIDPRDKVVELAGGGRLSYDRLLVTTGGSNRRPSILGIDLKGALQLRTVEESDAIRAQAGAGRRAVVVGMGFIGSEVTASLRAMGVEVTTVDGHRWPLARVLGEEVGEILAEVHREHGARLLLQESVAAFEGRGRVERVRTSGGSVIECDFAVVGMGIVPAVELLESAGAAVDDGVLVDELCRTSLPDVYAAGDLANHRHPVFGRLRVEHWNNASNQGRAAALSMLDQGSPYDYVHSFWSDQYDQSLEYVGFARAWDRVVFRGSRESRRFLAFYLLDGALQAVFGLNRGGDPEDPVQDGELKACVPLIRHHARIDPAALADPDYDLTNLTN
ncbi:MAG: FAD-dependent oxidoreductase [Candidatus Dormibacteraeota bacterium]|nr:FAD-dependent oxidoreductase [Candidatus Dormibacteraeota bacterium]